MQFDPTDPGFLRDRYPVYQRLRDEVPTLPVVIDGLDCRVVTRYADVDAILRDDRARVRPVSGDLPGRVGTGPAADFYRYSLPLIDPPDHARLRRLIMPAFGPRAVATMRGWITEIIDDCLDTLADLGPDTEFDFVELAAADVPARIACRLIHAPESDAELLLSRQQDLNAVLSQGVITAEALARADDAAKFYYDYFGDVIEGLRGTLPDGDVVGTLLTITDGGDRLGRIELITMLIGLLIASYHTTRVALTTAMSAYLARPEQVAALVADPTRAAGGWEEALRYDAPIHFIHRDLHAPMTVAGEQLDAGTHVLLGLAAANRDGRRFPDPDRFDPSRSDRRHMAFAAGGHYCPGAPLSRLEGEIFLSRFFARFPNARPARPHDEPSRHADLTFPFLLTLPMTIGVSA